MPRIHTDDPLTAALHQKIDNSITRPVVTPLYQNSAFTADSPYFYTRLNNPNCEELEQVVACFEEASHAITVTTGMAAISLASRLLAPGDHVVLNSLIYGCTYKFFQRLSRLLNLKITVLDLSQPASLQKIPADVRMVFFETPTNPFLKSISISAVAQRAKALNPSSLIVVDNTWATPMFQKPLQHGADISLYSATKYFSGHSDVMGGVVVVDRQDLAEQLRDERFYSGAILDPHSAWLIRRSMQTFALRMQSHQDSTSLLAKWLESLPQIIRVYQPHVDGRQLTGYGGILFCDLRQDLVERYTEFSQALRLFDTGTAMACVTSMVAQPYSGSHASMSADEKAEMGLGKELIRLCFGLENIEDLKRDIQNALEKIDTTQIEHRLPQEVSSVSE
ncbi:MAG: PLP-dependent transferase [Planctomycetaceae bacterium]|nr:PLP-dependent transferase [Planctomycetaceae bacterium]